MTRRVSKYVPNFGKGNKSIAIIGDGGTEKWYFQMLKQEEKVRIAIAFPQAKGNFKEIKNSIRENLNKGFTKIYWIVDFDVIVKENNEKKKGEPSVIAKYLDFFSELQRTNSNFHVLINNPCLEYWYLQHFEQTNRYYSNYNLLEPELKKFIPNYEKSEKFYKGGKNNIYKLLNPKLNDAIKNASLLNPITKSNYQKGFADIYKAVDYLRNL